MNPFLPPPLLAEASGSHPAAFWPVLLPLLAGALAVYFLLPRPQAFPALLGAALGALALLLAGALLVRVGGLTPETVLFYAFAGIAVASGCLLVTQRNPARAALSFALVVLSTCGLFLLLAAPFLMAATVIIYAGAIIVTFLFVIMLAQQAGLSDADARSREPLLSTATGFVLLGALLYVLELSYGRSDLDHLLDRTRRAAAQDSTEAIHQVVRERGDPDYLFHAYRDPLQDRGLTDLFERVRNLDEVKWGLDDSAEAKKETLASLAGIAEEARAQAPYRLAFRQPPGNAPVSNLSGPPANVPPQELRRGPGGWPHLPAENSAYLGRSLFTDYLLPVELGGMLLLVAAVGAIAIAHRRTSVEAPVSPSAVAGSGAGPGGRS
jgi:NADH:ubiquinone oxidoreductase subunit 6 (subunit J)